MGIFKKKSQSKQQELFTALDIGASKVCCAIARPTGSDDKKFQLLGVGHQASQGLKAGKIIDLDALENTIINAVHSAEKMAGETISDIYVNFPSTYTFSKTIQTQIEIGNQRIDDAHMRRLLTIDYKRHLQEDRDIIHALPITYVLDSAPGIRDPRGMHGKTLKAIFLVISAPSTIIQNLTLCLNRSQLNLAGFVVTPYASGLATLVKDELSLGATVIDLGGGNTTIASFLEGALVHFDSLPIGGSHITRDIARGLSTPLNHAERLKTLYGSLLEATSDEQETVVTPQLGEAGVAQNNHVPKSMLTRIIRSRVEETLEMAWDKLKASGMDRLVCQRIVLTGGGSQFHGIQDLATKIFNKPVRIGRPMQCQGISDFSQDPMFATCAGLLEYAWQDFTGRKETVKLVTEPQHMWHKVSGWIRENF